MIITSNVITKGAAAVAVLLIVLAIIFVIRSVLRPSVRSAGGAALFTVIAAYGRAERLEETIRGLASLQKRGAYSSRIIIADCGLDSYGRKLAELLTEDRDPFALCSPEDLPGVLEDCGWKRDTYK